MVSQSNELEQSSKLLIVARSDPQSLVWGTLLIIPRTAIRAPFVPETPPTPFIVRTWDASFLQTVCGHVQRLIPSAKAVQEHYLICGVTRCGVVSPAYRTLWDALYETHSEE